MHLLLDAHLLVVAADLGATATATIGVICSGARGAPSVGHTADHLARENAPEI